MQVWAIATVQAAAAAKASRISCEPNMQKVVRVNEVASRSTLKVRAVLLHHGSGPQEIFTHGLIALR